MKFKPITAVAILLVVVASLSVAGCTVTNTGNTTKTAANTSGEAITASYSNAGYDIMKAFTKSANKYGNDVYTGVVQRQ